jgi:hypothetical protein
MTTDFELPTENAAWDVDGFPKYVVDAFRSSKTSGQGRESKYKMALPRNYADPRFCPVVQKLIYLGMAKRYGLDMNKEGPIYPRIGADGLFVQPVGEREIKQGENGAHRLWLDAAGKEVNWTPDQWSRKLEKLFHATAEQCPDTPAGKKLRDVLLEATPYSLRKSAVKWAIHCGAALWQIDHAGRWAANSQNRAEYIQDGSFSRTLDEARQIARVWTFKPVTWVGLNTESAYHDHVFRCRHL